MRKSPSSSFRARGLPLFVLHARDCTVACARCGGASGQRRHQERWSSHLPACAEVSSELRQSLAGHKACALWMTGLSGSGKSTIAHRLERDLLLAGHRVFVLDGRHPASCLNHDLGFQRSGPARESATRRRGVEVMVEPA